MGNWEILLTAIGLMLIFEGIMPFLSPARLREMLSQIMRMNDRTMRTIGLGAMLVGLGLIYLVR
ncbi:MAG: DUF2065 domain-containing protein [Aquisalimonadaceae bacterium]